VKCLLHIYRSLVRYTRSPSQPATVHPKQWLISRSDVRLGTAHGTGHGARVWPPVRRWVGARYGYDLHSAHPSSGTHLEPGLQPRRHRAAGATYIYVGCQNAVDAAGSLVGEGDVATQCARALRNTMTALAAAGATLSDVVHWTVLFVDGVGLAAGYGANASEIASDDPALVTAARVAGLGVPGALAEISAVAAVLR
jgi:enamine deaminase RidA (YjgF/YER057c/UK114 family)